ncbi:MAG TPA: hypothetical protein G4N96_11120 [Chloroflexi bacterium]|nr:hypothetical protein [Chloroflexota bacterium]
MELFATATPLPLTPASDNERLILIASFQYTEGIANTDAHNEIRRTIRDTVTELDISNLRIEVEPNTRLAAEAQAEAKEPGEQYNASMVVWGEDTGVRVTVNFLNLTEPDFDAAAVKITETELAQLANPSAYASFITTDLPAQLTFLSLFAVGQSYYVQEEYREAVRIIEKALASLPSDMSPLEGVDDAYF